MTNKKSMVRLMNDYTYAGETLNKWKYKDPTGRESQYIPKDVFDEAFPEVDPTSLSFNLVAEVTAASKQAVE